MKTALITGVTGQDGLYLAEQFLEKGYRVVGMTRRTSTVTLERIAHLADDIKLVQGDLLDQKSLSEALRTIKPHAPRATCVRALLELAVGSETSVAWPGGRPRARDSSSVRLSGREDHDA